MVVRRVPRRARRAMGRIRMEQNPRGAVQRVNADVGVGWRIVRWRLPGGVV
jgi:hypothetical protein